MSSLKVKRARKRIKSVNAAATESMKLCNRTRSALDFLLQCKNISRIVGSLVNLGKLKLEEYVGDWNPFLHIVVLLQSNESLPQGNRSKTNSKHTGVLGFKYASGFLILQYVARWQR